MDVKELTSKVKDELQETTKEAVKETVDEMSKEMVSMIKEELIDQLSLKKENLIEQLTDEIISTNNWGIKARDYLYIFAIKVLDRIYEGIKEEVNETV